VAPGVSGNEKKFQALVSDFVNATAELGATIDPEIATIELRQRIQLIAAQIGVTEATVLRNHMPDGWGRDMARQTYRQIQERDAHIDAEPDHQLPLKSVGRLIAALSQALLFHTVNNVATDLTCRFNPKEAAEALTGLGMALSAHPGDDCPITVPGNVLAWTKDALIAFADNLDQQRWSSCPCGQDCGQRVTDASVLRAVRDDLQLLPGTISA
jgi:hypothetical protein